DATESRRQARSLRQNDLVEAQRLANRPRLERAAARRERRIAIGDLGHVADAGLVEMAEQRREEPPPRVALRLARAAAHAHPGVDEAAEQPRPRRALVIAAVAAAHVALIAPRIAGPTGSRRAQAV